MHRGRLKGVVVVVWFSLCFFLTGLGKVAAEDRIALEKRLLVLEKRVKVLEERNRYLEFQLQHFQDSPPLTAKQRKQIAQIGQEEMNEESLEAPGIKWSDLISKDNRLKFYGFLRLDTIYHDSKPQHPQYTYWIQPEDPAGKDNNDNEINIYPRLTRFGIDYDGPQVGHLFGLDLEGKFEMDFQNGGSESRQIPRIRHAYLKLVRRDFSILAGQTWDIISPLYPTVNSDSLMWNAGNLGDRRPQLRLIYEPKIGQGRLSFMGGPALSSAVDAKDLDNNGTRDGEDSGLPNLQFRIGYSAPLWHKERLASLGIWGLRGWEDSLERFDSYVYGLDLFLPLSSSFTLRGEIWKGRNLSDFRGGIAQGIEATGRREIDSIGGWAELVCRIAPWFTFAPGYTLDNPDDGDLAPGSRSKNWTLYLANRFSLGGGFLMGLDYIYWKTEYKGLKEGDANRFDLFLQYNF
jgi:hypothetical protein